MRNQKSNNDCVSLLCFGKRKFLPNIKVIKSGNVNASSFDAYQRNK